MPESRSPWYENRPDRRVHGVLWLTDEEALARLTRDPGWETRPPALRRLESSPAPAPGRYWGANTMPEFDDPKEN